MRKKLSEVLRSHAGRNRKLDSYYMERTPLHQIYWWRPRSYPPFYVSLGWAKKAVDLLASRVVFRGFLTSTGERASLPLDHDVFDVTLAKAITSTLIHGCAFLSVSYERGFFTVDAYSARRAAVVLDDATGSVAAGGVFSGDTLSVLHTPGEVAWDGGSMSTGSSIATLVPLVHQSSLYRPLGQSRITPALMSLVDAGVRTQVRTEINAESYARLQRAVLGIDDPADFMKNFTDAPGGVIAVSTSAEGTNPSLAQWSTPTPAPQVELMRMFARLAAAETSIPVEDLGFPSENPSSADAISAQRESLLFIADAFIKSLTISLKTLLRIMHDMSGIDVDDLYPAFESPEKQTTAQLADALVKQSTILPSLTSTQIPARRLGYSEAEIAELESALQAAQAKQDAQELLAITAELQRREYEESK